MNCPVDGAELVMSERQGVEIDYCPTCRGVWLDRGELDKIIDRNASHYGDQNIRQAPVRHPEHPAGRKKKHKDFLSELFEFG